MACVNQNTPEFQDLLQRTGLPIDILSAIVGQYQKINGINSFPTVNEILSRINPNSDVEFNSFTGYDAQVIDGIFTESRKVQPKSFSFDVIDSVTPTENYAISLTQSSNKRNPKGHKGVNSLVLLKERSKDFAQNKLTLLNTAIKQHRVTDLRKAIETKTSLEQTIERLDAEINKLSTMKSSILAVLKPYIESELQHAEVLSNSDDFFDLQKASDTIKYVQSLNNFTNVENHPLFLIDEIMDFGVMNVSPEARELLDDWDKQATLLEEKIQQNKQKKLNDFMEHDPTVQLARQKLGDDYLSQIDVGVKDITVVDQYFFGIRNNFLGKDHWIPTVTIRMYHEAMVREFSKVKNYQERMEKIQPDVVRKLKGMGETLQKYGVDVSVHSFELFRRRTPEGQKTSNLIRKHTIAWDEYIYDAVERFKNIRDDIFKTRKADPVAAFNQLLEKSMQRNNSLQENTEWFDPAKVPEIIEFIKGDEKYAEYVPYLVENESLDFKQQMINLMGENQYQKTVEEAIDNFQQFFERKELEFDTNNVAEEAQKKTSMTQGVWDRKYSPFVNPYTMDVNKANNTINISELNFHNLIPKRNNKKGDTGFYDVIFENTIESDATFSEFYSIVEEMLNYIYDSFDEAGRKLIQDPLFIPEQAKNMTDIFYESVSFNQKMKNLVKFFWDWLRNKWSANPIDNYSPLRVNQNTGEPSYMINQGFLRANRSKFDAIYQITKKKFAAVYSAIHAVENGNQVTRPEAPLRRNQTIRLSQLSNETLLGMLNEYQGTPNWTSEQWRVKYGENIPVASIIYKYSQHQVAVETSFDLPRILSLYAAAAAENAARHEVLPEAVMLKNKYESLKNTDNPEQVTAELRTKANARYGWWFDKNILNYSHNTQSMWVKARDKILPKDPNTENKKIVKGQARNVKTYDSFQKGLIRDIDEYLAENSDRLSQSDLAAFNNIKNNMGDSVSVTAILDSILNFIRLKALGWNLSSSMTNVFAGQLSNSIIAISGRYFPYQYLHTVTFNDLLDASAKSKFNKSWVGQNEKKAISFFKKTDVKQDATNELQKASKKSFFNSKFKEVIDPFWGITRGEDFNQIPLFVAYLRTKTVKGIDGTEASVWDALEAYDILDENGKCIGWNTKLKENFATEENKKNWEELEGKEYAEFKNQVENLIITGHGDFSNYSGMMIKEDIFGRMIMMFKTWLPMEFHKRWAKEQYDFTMGTNIKGRYRSHTATTLGTQGALIGAFAFGPLGALIGAGVGGAFGKYVSNKLPKASSEMQDGSGSIANRGKNLLDHLNESIIMAQFLAKRIASFFINPAAKAVTGKRPIDIERVYYNGKWQHLDDALGVNGEDFTKTDLENWKSNVQEIGMTLVYMGLLLLLKAFTFDEDDEKDSIKRKLHNAGVNKLMQLAEETTMYLDPIDEKMGLKTIWSVGTFSFLDNVGKTVAAIADSIDGEDIYLAGPNAGQNKFLVNANRTFIPGIFGSINRELIGDREPDFLDIAGFSALSERQFQNTPIDKYFTPKKNEEADNKNLRLKRKKELEKEGKSEKEITKILNKELPTPAQIAAKERRSRKKKSDN